MGKYCLRRALPEREEGMVAVETENMSVREVLSTVPTPATPALRELEADLPVGKRVERASAWEEVTPVSCRQRMSWDLRQVRRNLMILR